MSKNITYQMMEAYAELRSDEERFETALRLDHPGVIVESAIKLLDSGIPDFLKAVPEQVRRNLSHGNPKYIERLASDARAYFSQYIGSIKLEVELRKRNPVPH